MNSFDRVTFLWFIIMGGLFSYQLNFGTKLSFVLTAIGLLLSAVSCGLVVATQKLSRDTHEVRSKEPEQ